MRSMADTVPTPTVQTIYTSHKPISLADRYCAVHRNTMGLSLGSQEFDFFYSIIIVMGKNPLTCHPTPRFPSMSKVSCHLVLTSGQVDSFLWSSLNWKPLLIGNAASSCPPIKAKYTSTTTTSLERKGCAVSSNPATFPELLGLFLITAVPVCFSKFSVNWEGLRNRYSFRWIPGADFSK